MSATPLQRAPVPAGTAPRQRKKQTIRKTGLFGFFNPKDHACQTSPASKTAFAQHPQGRAKKPSLANPSQKEPATGHVPSSRFPNIRATPHLTGRARSLRQDMQKPKSQKAVGGARRDRTDDLKLAKLALSQLSYGPLSDRLYTNAYFLHKPTPNKGLVGLGRFELPTPRLSSVCSDQLSYRPT